MSQQLSQRMLQARPVSPLRAHLQCGSCSKPLFNACQTPHGCRLCQPCVTDLLSPVEKRRCPRNTEACRDLSEEIDVSQATCLPDMATRREVAKLQVCCPNCNAGCSVQLAWALMDRHVQDSCDFRTLGCELCDQQIMKKDMQCHTSRECPQRKETCDLCSQLVTVSEMETRHRNLESYVCCPRFSAHCPHCLDRSRQMDRRAYAAHLADCPEKPVECKYSHLGCGARVRRSELEQHYRDCMDSHLELMDCRLRQASTVQQNAAGSGLPRQANDILTPTRSSYDARQTVAPQQLGQSEELLADRPWCFPSLCASGGAMQASHPVSNSSSADCPIRPLNQPMPLLSELLVRPGHAGQVTAACCFPGSRQIAASGGADGAVVLWDLDCMRQLMRVRAPPDWGPVTNLVALTAGVLVASWTNLNGLVRLSCQERALQDSHTAELLDLLRSGDAELLRSSSPAAAISAVPESAKAMIAFTGCSFALVSAGGCLRPLPWCTHLDPRAGPPVFLQSLEQGYFLVRQLRSPRIHSAQLSTAQEGPAIICRWPSVAHPDMEIAGASSTMQACAAGNVPGCAFLLFQCQIPGRMSVVQLGSDLRIYPVVTRFMCHTEPLTRTCLLGNGPTGNLPMLATASADGEICVWGMQTRALANQLVELAQYSHSNEVTVLRHQPSDNGQLKLLGGDAQGSFLCLQ